MNSTFLKSLQTLKNKSFLTYPSPDHPPSPYFVEVVRTGVSKVNGRVWMGGGLGRRGRGRREYGERKRVIFIGCEVCGKYEKSEMSYQSLVFLSIGFEPIKITKKVCFIYFYLFLYFPRNPITFPKGSLI